MSSASHTAEIEALEQRLAELRADAIPRGLSRARHLHAEAERRGVTTMWLKDLGYTLEPNGDTWELVPPAFNAAHLLAATEALAEIVAATKLVQGPDGVRMEMPSDAHLWIAKAMADAQAG